MRLRTVPFVIQLTVTFLLVGCNDSGNRPAVPPATQPAATAPQPTVAPQVQIQPLPADKLAQIMGVTIWTARFSGGPIECWLEIEEEGQSTLPRRIPEKDFVGAGSANRPTEGTIYLWWTKRENQQGGHLWIDVADAIQGYDLNKDAFTFAWGTFFSSHTKFGDGELMNAKPGEEFVVVNYEAGEPREAGSKKTPRHVRMKLMGRFPIKK
jgi:hypothetical protein